MRTLLCVVTVGLLAACASIQRIDYSPNPSRVEDPRQEIATLIKANVTSGCIAEPHFEQMLLQVKYVCPGGFGNTVSRLDKITSVHLEQYKEWYRVVVRHSAGEDFHWTSKTLEDMQRMADAFTALQQPTAPAPEKNPVTL